MFKPVCLRPLSGLWLLCSALLLAGCGSDTMTLPEFALPDAQGQTQPSQQWQGQVRVLNFWATWCAPCRKEIPMLVQAQRDYADADLQIIGLAIDDADAVRRFADQYGINYPLLVEANAVARLQDQLRAGNGLPATVIVDRDGRIRERARGELDREQLDALVEPWL